MNETNPTNPSVPPQIPPAGAWLPPHMPRSLGDDPADREPVPNLIAAIDAILRHPRRVMYHLRQPGSGKIVAAMLFVALACGLVYGVIVGSFSGGVQWWAAPVKVAGGLLISAVICLPSLYIFGCLSGSQAGLAEVFGLVSGLLMVMTI